MQKKKKHERDDRYQFMVMASSMENASVAHQRSNKSQKSYKYLIQRKSLIKTEWIKPI